MERSPRQETTQKILDLNQLNFRPNRPNRQENFSMFITK